MSLSLEQIERLGPERLMELARHAATLQSLEQMPACDIEKALREIRLSYDDEMKVVERLAAKPWTAACNARTSGQTL